MLIKVWPIVQYVLSKWRFERTRALLSKKNYLQHWRYHFLLHVAWGLRCFQNIRGNVPVIQMTWLLKLSVASSKAQHNVQKTDWHLAYYKHHKRKESLVLGLKDQGTSDCQLLLSCTVVSFNLSCLPLLTFAIIWLAETTINNIGGATRADLGGWVERAPATPVFFEINFCSFLNKFWEKLKIFIYSRLPITRTFKGNRKKVRVIASSKKIAEIKVKDSF